VDVSTEHSDQDGGAEGAGAERPYVSRGGVKLANALGAAGLSVSGRLAVDVGASTGGFTDCLLRAGASRVIAVDVGYGQLDWGLRNDPRVHVLERVNARALRPDLLPFAPDFAVVDVSFISLAKVLPAVLACLTARHDVFALIKPQFEVGRKNVGKGGVVRSPEDRRRALECVGEAALVLGEAVVGFYPARLPGPKGNQETFIWLAGRGRAAAARDIQGVRGMATAVEPSPEAPPLDGV
jgi:23S rRNA (cytidine1920-2'-O)/16S rRNA (cytidine1409-2'-O)-methyltransferase